MVLWKSLGEYGGCLKVVCSPPAWMCCMIQSAWSNPSTVPMTATCRWTSVRGSRYELGDQCRMWFVGCAPTVQRGESRSGGIVLVVVVDLEVDVVLHDVVGKRSEE